jgi:NAD(P)-dependent dehydrogenase (short-subunit alcohol dehydrogenase family)
MGQKEYTVQFDCAVDSGHRNVCSNLFELNYRLGTNLDIAGLEDTPENRDKLADPIPLGRLCKLSDVANTACFLASDDASYITGVQIPVDGGRAI